MDTSARKLIESGKVAFVILDGSPHTRHVLATPERVAAADWVRATFPLVWRSPEGVYPTEVYRTAP